MAKEEKTTDNSLNENPERPATQKKDRFLRLIGDSMCLGQEKIKEESRFPQGVLGQRVEGV